MQRTLDILFSGLALLLLSPLLLPIVLLLRLTGEGEIFFLQERVGKDGKPFKLYKFATMLKNSPNIGTGTVTMKNDPRVLPMGKFLRKTKINELPQLLNIFLGDMSVVGPRPQAQKNFNAFPLQLQEIIVKVKPGLSGLGPIVFRGEEDILADHAGSVTFYNNIIAPYKGQVEAWYVHNQSLSTYFLIILVTLWVIFFPSSSIAWRVFKNLPAPPDDLVAPLNYPF
jgi:lipopolysaccharide/colanic/teichoic acid biosynthesis glycosyltransferase